MSLKVIHTKRDGTQVPIKVSIWDAFKGVPDLKPRKIRPCHCCGKMHCQAKAKQSSRAEGKNHQNAKGKGRGKGDHKDDLTEDDRTVLRMKNSKGGSSWQMILEATSFNNMAELKARWQEIQHLSNEGNDDINGGGRKKDKAKEDRTEDWIKKQKEEGQKKKAEREAAKRGDVYIDHKHDDDKKSRKPSSAPNALKKWAEEYDKNKGQVLASRHFDRTGVRISAKDALKMAAEE